ncbi:MAG: EAL domain-containing protein [Lachnospiraceae bacterium]|nr:EAL domain-containing protein [Lachnospiraceae bacterium]
MGRYNNGMITTNDKCVACNHCVHVCPAMGANVSSNNEGRISIDVSDKNCIHCGKCIKECIHNAREYKDSLDDLLLDIKRGAQVSVIVDPTFTVAYGMDRARQVFGYLKSLGIKGVYDASIGGTISLYYHIDHLRKNMIDGISDRFYAHICPGFSNYVSRYAPEGLDKFIPVQLPNVCAAIYYRKYKEIKTRFALLSPCTAIYDEFSSYNSGRNINYLIGFSSLLDYIGERDISSFDSGFDLECDRMGAVICENGAFSQIVSGYFASNLIFRSCTGIDTKLDKVLKTPSFASSGAHPALVTVELCRTGCIDGPGIAKGSVDMDCSVPEYIKLYNRSLEADDDKLSPDEKFARLQERYKDLNLLDFAWEGEEDYHQKCSVPENVVEEIFTSMHKTTDVKKALNCEACGYRTCYEMACAVANGYSRIEDCVHYLNDEMKAKMGIDSLTGLLNQRGFFSEATHLVADNPDKHYLLVIGDINGLGGINDLYNSMGGDRVIVYVAKTLEEFSDKRGICARMGAGTFGCIFENTKENMEKFRADTQLSVVHLGIEYPLSLKFGMYEINDLSTTIPRATLYATYAYRTAKDRSRNTYVLYTEEMSKSMQQEAEVTQKMKSAMDNDEFVLFMQPKYDHRSKKMVGAEVLSRWIKPDGTVISPGVFIPVFEKNGYIRELDRFVWRTSFETVNKWLKNGQTAVPVSVNISRISLLDEEIVSFIDRIGTYYPAAKEYIQFEITESAYAGDTKEIFERVRRIQEMGFKINMDDFGSGYSSLNLLKDAPIDIVKLDMGFLRGEENNKSIDRGNVIISAVVNMTKELGFDIIAEGVETKEQADLLTDAGCSVIQGFYYAKPLPEEEFCKLL